MTSSDNEHDIKRFGIGIGVAIPVFVILVVCLFYCGFRKQRIRLSKGALVREKHQKTIGKTLATLESTQQQHTDVVIQVQAPMPVPPSPAPAIESDERQPNDTSNDKALTYFIDNPEPTLLPKQSADAIETWRNDISVPRGRPAQLTSAPIFNDTHAYNWVEAVELPTLRSTPRGSPNRRSIRTSTDTQSNRSAKVASRRRYSSSHHRRYSTSTARSERPRSGMSGDGKALLGLLRGEGQPMRAGLVPTHLMSSGSGTPRGEAIAIQHHLRNSSEPMAASDQMQGTSGSIPHRHIAGTTLRTDDEAEPQLRSRKHADDPRTTAASTITKDGTMEAVTGHHRKLSSDATLMGHAFPSLAEDGIGKRERGHHRRYSSDVTVINPPPTERYSEVAAGTLDTNIEKRVTSRNGGPEGYGSNGNTEGEL